MPSRSGWNGSVGRILPVGRSLETPALDQGQKANVLEKARVM